MGYGVMVDLLVWWGVFVWHMWVVLRLVGGCIWFGLGARLGLLVDLLCCVICGLFASVLL